MKIDRVRLPADPAEGEPHLKEEAADLGKQVCAVA
jgi:hypothetical protein